MAGFRAFYSASVQVGTILLNFAVLLAVLALGMMAYRLREAGQIEGKANRPLKIGLVASVLAMALSFALLALVENLLASTLLRLALITVFGAFAVDYWKNNPGGLPRTFISLLAWGYIIPLAAKLLHDLLPLAGLNWQIFLYEPLIEGGELLVIINTFVLYLVYGNTRQGNSPLRDMVAHWRAFIGAVILVGIFLGLTFVTVAESFIVPILGLYALGYPMHWPMAIYPVGLFFLAYTIFYNLEEFRRGEVQKAAALGLNLIFCGGYLFNISDQYLFALAGVLLLIRPELTRKPGEIAGPVTI